MQPGPFQAGGDQPFGNLQPTPGWDDYVRFPSAGQCVRFLGGAEGDDAGWGCDLLDHWGFELAPKFAQPHHELGNVYQDLSRYEESIVAYQRAIELDPKLTYPYSNLAGIYIIQGKLD